jgi:hypothetical protein
MHMNIEHLYAAVDRVREHRYTARSKEASFLRAYPAMIAAAQLEAKDPREAFLRIAALAHAWMPHALRLDDAFLGAATDSLEQIRSGKVTISAAVIQPIADCVSSLIGASKVLHLANPAVFPLWDKRVERFRIREAPDAYHMSQARNYLGFIEDVWTVTSDPHFLTFHHDYCTAYQERLQRLRIAPYPLTEARVVQSATSELASD